MLRLRPHIVLLTVWLAAAGAAPRSAFGEAFVEGLEDMPLMPGLTQLRDRAVIFDAPSGRVVEVYAEGSVARDAVVQFYARTLPQLGWRMTDGDGYAREGETLRLEILPARPGTKRLLVRFFVSPG